MTDQRVERMDDQANALAESLKELLVGRPIDVVVNALGTAATLAVLREDALTDHEIDSAFEGAGSFASSALSTVIPASRRKRLWFTLYALHLATLSSCMINEGGK